MNYNYIVNPLTNRKCSIHSRNGKQILKGYLNQAGGVCGACGADQGGNATTCPWKIDIGRLESNRRLRKDASLKNRKHKSVNPHEEVRRDVQDVPRRYPEFPHEDIIIGPHYVAYFNNVILPIERETGITVGRNILLFGEEHVDGVIDPESTSYSYFDNWIQNIAKNYPGCIDFFLEGAALFNKFSFYNWITKRTEDAYIPTLKSNKPIVYRGGAGEWAGGENTKMIENLRDIFNPQKFGRSQIKEYPNFRYHFVDIRQIEDTRDIRKDVNLTLIENFLKEKMVGCIEILNNIKESIINTYQSGKEIDKRILDYFIGDDILLGKPSVSIMPIKPPILDPYRAINEIFNYSPPPSDSRVEYNPHDIFEYLLNDSVFKPLTDRSFDGIIERILRGSDNFIRNMEYLYENNIIERKLNLHEKFIVCLGNYMELLKDRKDNINESIQFMKYVLDKQFSKSLLTKSDFYKNQDIWIRYLHNYYNNTLSFETIVMLMDIYTLCRMFAKFDKHKIDRGPFACTDPKYSSPRNIIFYGGAAHSKIYKVFIERVSGHRSIFKNENTEGTNEIPYGRISLFFENFI